MASSNELPMDASPARVLAPTTRRMRRATEDLESGDYSELTSELVEHWAATRESPPLDESHGSRPSWSL